MQKYFEVGGGNGAPTLFIYRFNYFSFFFVGGGCISVRHICSDKTVILEKYVYKLEDMFSRVFFR